jgi:NADPH-dependent ferric siderophore reductase
VSGEPKRVPPRLLQVLEARNVSPHVRRMVLGGVALSGLVAWPAAHIKLFFPRPGQAQLRLPTLDDQGRPVWPPLAERPITRTYSVRRHDPRLSLLEVDFVLHEPGGIASQWAARAEPGMHVGLAGPGGPNPMLKAADWYLLAGDLSAISAIAALLEALPPSARGCAFVQIASERDRQVIAAPPGVQITWLVTEQRVHPCTDLVESVRNVSWPRANAFAWIAGENGQVIAIRDHLRRERGLTGDALYAVPYWKQNESEEQYHAERHRVMDELLEEAP